MHAAPPRPHRWTREAYDRSVAAGVFQPGDRVQLVEGEIIEMSPHNTPHALAVGLVQDVLQLRLPPGSHLRVQLPLALGGRSEPEPDAAVVVGPRRDYLEAHPSSALLVVEVADSSLDFDRTRKGPLYARHGIAEYWIVNLADRCIEVRTAPAGLAAEGESAGAGAGTGYASCAVFAAGMRFKSAALADAEVSTDELLP